MTQKLYDHVLSQIEAQAIQIGENCSHLHDLMLAAQTPELPPPLGADSAETRVHHDALPTNSASLTLEATIHEQKVQLRLPFPRGDA